MLKLEILRQVLACLDSYVRLSNWTGYDPYDLKAHPLYLKLQRSRLTAFLAKAIANFFPLTARRILHIQPLPHPKAMALFAEAYVTLFDLTGEQTYRTLAEGRLAWLQEHPAPGFEGLAWGLPFDFKGRAFVPAGVPSVVITAIAAQAFLHAYRSLGVDEYLEAANSVCRFLVSDVARYEPDGERLCFTKMPGVAWYVHNANVMVAATLAMVGQEVGAHAWDDLVRRAVTYTLAEQREDGAWYYWGPPNQLKHWIDHYHTGFILRALDSLLAVTGWTDLQDPLDRGYAYYKQNLFDEGCIPRLTDKRRYPIDIHSCAEAIICLSQLSHRYADALERAQAVAHWTITHMRHPRGYFYYRRYPWFTSKIPYMRWGQAWMLVALTHLQKALKSSGSLNLGKVEYE
jgi:hypothetical protein